MDTQVFDKVENPKKSQDDDVKISNKKKSKSTDESTENSKIKKDVPSSLMSGLFDWASAFLFALIVVVMLMTFCFRLVDVDGSSMLETLQDGNKVIVTGLNYEPKAGDIVVISHGAELDKALVKRVIAVGGQTVDINSITGEVLVDGTALEESAYTNGKTVADGDSEFPMYVEEGTVFVLGDNRPISKDSRYTDVGLIDVNNIIGKVGFRIYPLDEFGKVE